MAGIIVGILMMAIAAFFAVPGVIRRFYERLRPLYRAMGATDRQFAFVAKAGRVWIPLFFLMMGVVALLTGAGVFD